MLAVLAVSAASFTWTAVGVEPPDMRYSRTVGALAPPVAEALDPSATYIVYCQSGRRSALAAAAMVEAGFTQVFDMGGIQDWLAAGLPVVTG